MDSIWTRTRLYGLRNSSVLLQLTARTLSTTARPLWDEPRSNPFYMLENPSVVPVVTDRWTRIRQKRLYFPFKPYIGSIIRHQSPFPPFPAFHYSHNLCTIDRIVSFLSFLRYSEYNGSDPSLPIPIICEKGCTGSTGDPASEQGSFPLPSASLNRVRKAPDGGLVEDVSDDDAKLECVSLLGDATFRAGLGGFRSIERFTS